jgi:hypothetical protein
VGPALALSRAIQDRIGNELRAMYEASSCEPVPVRLIELMNRLERTTPPDDRGHGRLTNGVRPFRWTASCCGFDQALGVLILEVDGAAVAEG